MAKRLDVSDSNVYAQPDIPVTPRNARQGVLKKQLLDITKPMVIAAGEAGAGKTFWACEAAAALLKAGLI